MVRYASFCLSRVPSGSYSFEYESDDACFPVHPVGNLLIGWEITNSKFCRRMPNTRPLLSSAVYSCEASGNGQAHFLTEAKESCHISRFCRRRMWRAVNDTWRWK